MTDYSAPLKEMQFVLRELADLDAIAALPGHEDTGEELAYAVLEEAAKFAGGVLSPLNAVGDREGSRWNDGDVSTPTGWRDAYAQFTASGWNGLRAPVEFGGQGLPRVLSTLVDEIWNSANMSFALCPMLTRGAIEALEFCGSEQQKSLYLPRMVSGEWTGTMNLTEPQAGSDLAAVRTRAIPAEDGSYRLFGQKIFITYGEHDLAGNIVHLVLARTPDAPEGVKGISLFVCPKFLVGPDGALGARNDVRCTSIEHKLGIHASPTCVLQFGEGDGAHGWLLGKENRGLQYMFVMMNAARFSVGIEGIGLAERTYQRARAYAAARVQGAEIGAGSRDKVAILRHPDVRRMLLRMKSRTEALRAVAVTVAAAMDRADGHPDPGERQRQQAFVDLMIPVVKGWSTESAVQIAAQGIQVHGGMGFIEETGAAQHLRDAIITPIYEGTTGIQAADLVGRKVTGDDGQAAKAAITRMREVQQQLHASDDAGLQAFGRQLQSGIDALEESVSFILRSEDMRVSAAASVPFLELFGIVAGGWQMGRAGLAAARRLVAGDPDPAFLQAKLLSVRFYADHVLSSAPGLAHTVLQGANAVLAIEDEQF